MDHRVLNNPMTREQTLLAAKVNIYFVIRDAVIRHQVDGGLNLPAGRCVLLIQKRKPEVDDEYRCQELVVAAPGANDPRSKLKEAKVIQSKKGFRLLVIPLGKELEYLANVATLGKLYHPLLGNENSQPSMTRKQALTSSRRKPIH